MNSSLRQGEITALLSPERMATFQGITGNEADALLVHNQALAVAAALMPVIAMIEIVLRNGICEQLRPFAGPEAPNWLLSPAPNRLKWHEDEQRKLHEAVRHAQRAAYGKLTNPQKTSLDGKAFPGGVPNGIKRAKRVRQRQEQIQVGLGQVIAQLTLGFWKGLFAAEYEAALWKPVLRKLFPNKAVTRLVVAAHLETLYGARNRLAHHEPIMQARLDAVMASLEWVILNFGQTAPSPESSLGLLAGEFFEAARVQRDALENLLARYAVT